MIDDSFGRKFNNFRNNIISNLDIKTDIIIEKLHVIEKDIESVKEARRDIDREIRKEYEEILEKLKDEEGRKIAVLQFESADINKEMNNITDISNEFKMINPDDMQQRLSFLLKYSKLKEKAEMIIAKPNIRYAKDKVKSEQDSVKFDCYKDFIKKNKKLSKYNKLKMIIKAKDDIIWNLLNQKDSINNTKDIYYEECINNIKQNDSIKEQSHIKNLLQLHDKLSEKLNKFDLICIFCGGSLENNINSTCKANAEIGPNYNDNIKQSNSIHQLIISPDIKVNQDVYNNNKHFFVDKVKIQYKSTNTTSDYNTNNCNKHNTHKRVQSSVSNSSVNNCKSSMSVSYIDLRNGFKNINGWVFKIASVIEKNKLNIYKILSEYDFKEEGIITVYDLLQALNKLQIILSRHDIDYMLKYLKAEKNGVVSVKEFSKNFVTNTLR